MSKISQIGGILDLLLAFYTPARAQHINSINPADPIQGGSFKIVGSGFGDKQGSWVVEVYRVVNRRYLTYRVVELVDTHRGRARAHACKIRQENPTEVPDYLDQGTLQWFNDHIIAIVPSELEPGPFLLRILDKSNNRSSNTVRVLVEKGRRE